MTGLTEEALMVPVGNLWRRHGVRIAYEVPLFGRFLDMVVVHVPGPVVAIELKLRHWRQALKQAVVAQLAADQSYIAIWHEAAHRVDHHLLNVSGVGLIVVEAQCARISLPAPPSPITLREHRDAIAAWIKPACGSPNEG